MLSVIYYINGDPNSEGSTKHVVEFFGIFGCIKVNALRQKVPAKLDGFNVVEYYFDYPYFSKIVNPEHFQKRLDDGEKRFTRIIASLWSCAAILSIASNVLLYLAYNNQKSQKVLAVLATASAVLSTIACIFFVAGLLWVFFDFVKEKLVIHRIKSLLKDELSDEWITLFKEKFLGEKSEISEEADDKELERDKDKGTNDKELEKDKNIEEILQFFLERRKIPALFKFLTNGEELVQAGMAMVNRLLLAGKHPNDIVLDTNSMGGGIATEVLKRFEKQGIYLTLIHSNSYSSLRDVSSTFKGKLAAQCLNILHKFFGLEFNSKEDIKEMKSPVLIAGRKGDPIIIGSARLVGKLPDLDGKNGNQLRRNVILEHDPKTKEHCKNKNIHTDDPEHLVSQRKINDTVEYTPFPEIKSEFIIKAHNYLINSGLNEKFDLEEEYKGSEFSEKLSQITLEPFKQVDCSRAQKVTQCNNNVHLLTAAV